MLTYMYNILTNCAVNWAIRDYMITETWSDALELSI